MAGNATVAPQAGEDTLLVGDTPLIACAFTVDSAATATATLRNGDTLSVEGVLTDPTAVQLVISKPDGASNTYTYAGATVSKFATGVFDKADYTLDQAGDYIAVWTATGTVADVAVARFTVLPTAGVFYCSLESLKSRLQITDARHDAELLSAARTAKEQIDGYVGRPFGFGRDATVTTRTYTPDSLHLLRIPEGISTATGVIVKLDEDGDGTYETTLTVSTDYQLRPSSAITDSEPFTEIWLSDNYHFPSLWNGREGVQVTARFGWPSIPSSIREAALIASHRIFDTRKTSTGVVGFGGDGIVVRLAETDPTFRALLRRFEPALVG